jgi:hypothetical protein
MPLEFSLLPSATSFFLFFLPNLMPHCTKSVAQRVCTEKNSMRLTIWRDKPADNAKEKSNPAYIELAPSQTQATEIESTALSSSSSDSIKIWIRGTLESKNSCNRLELNSYPTHCCDANTHTDRMGFCLACMAQHCKTFDFAARCEDISMSNRNPQALCGHCTTPCTFVGGPGAGVQHEPVVASESSESADEEQPRPPRTWGQCCCQSILFWFMRDEGKTWGDFCWTRSCTLILIVSITAPIWVTVLIILLKTDPKDGGWCGCILGASAQNYDANAEASAKDCYPMMNGSIVLNSNCYWSNGATFRQAAQAWPLLALTNECDNL